MLSLLNPLNQHLLQSWKLLLSITSWLKQASFATNQEKQATLYGDSDLQICFYGKGVLCGSFVTFLSLLPSHSKSLLNLSSVFSTSQVQGNNGTAYVGSESKTLLVKASLPSRDSLFSHLSKTPTITFCLATKGRSKIAIR